MKDQTAEETFCESLIILKSPVAMLEQTLVFDITDLAYKQEAGSQIYLQIEGAKERILYTYK